MEDRCRARCVLVDGIVKTLTGGPHNHAPHIDKIAKILKRNDPAEYKDEPKIEYWTMDNLGGSPIEVFDEALLASD